MNNKKNNPGLPAGGLAGFARRSLPEAHGEVAPRPTGEALEAAIQATIDELGDDLDGGLEQGARLALAWRVARALGAAQNHLDFDTRLADVPEAAWRSHTASYTQGKPNGPAWLQAVAAVPVGLVPIAQTATVFADVLWTIACRLGIRATSGGRLGLFSLLDELESHASPENAGLAWPTPEEIMTFEDALVLHTLRLATESPAGGASNGDSEPASTGKAERVLRQDYGLTEPEVRSIMAMVRVRALELLPTGELGRAMTWASLEDGVRRSQAAMDLRSELNFRKLQAMVLGLTRGQGPEDQAQEFLNVVKRVVQIQEHERPAALPPSIRPIPDDLPEGASLREVVEDADDEDAVREWDEENSQ